jgi:hypothetical protein
MLFSNANIGQDYNSLFFSCSDELIELNNRVVADFYDPNLPRILNTWEDSKSERKKNTFILLNQEEFTEEWIQLYQSFVKSF